MASHSESFIKSTALNELAAEERRALIDAEKARIRVRRTLLQRWLSVFPFTLTLTRKPK